MLKTFIITGRSGSGKSTAMAAFEDAGFFCVDNMPVALLPEFMNLAREGESKPLGYAFVMDLRESGFLDKYPAVFKQLNAQGHRLKILFFEADENTLIRRYSQTRRPHPLGTGKTLIESIQAEKELLTQLRNEAHQVINTSNTNVHELKRTILAFAESNRIDVTMRINILSFGFKYGVPSDADLIADVRFLRNPYFISELRPLSGKSAKVRDYVLQNEETRLFLNKYLDLLDFLIPLYQKEGKTYLTIAVGCTGGRHRSVAIAEHLFGNIRQPGKDIKIAHRDMEKG